VSAEGAAQEAYREQPETERTPARAEAVLKASSLLPGTEGSNPVPSSRESAANSVRPLVGNGAPFGSPELLKTIGPELLEGGFGRDVGGRFAQTGSL